MILAALLNMIVVAGGEWLFRDYLSVHRTIFSGERFTMTARWECPELCLSCLFHGFSDTQASKRSRTMMAN